MTDRKPEPCPWLPSSRLLAFAAGDGELMFAVREIDDKYLRGKTEGASEQAHRVAIRGKIQALELTIGAAETNQISALKKYGTLGARAPSCMLIGGQHAVRLLKEFGRKKCAETFAKALTDREALKRLDESEKSGEESNRDTESDSGGDANASNRAAAAGGDKILDHKIPPRIRKPRDRYKSAISKQVGVSATANSSPRARKTRVSQAAANTGIDPTDIATAAAINESRAASEAAAVALSLMRRQTRASAAAIASPTVRPPPRQRKPPAAAPTAQSTEASELPVGQKARRRRRRPFKPPRKRNRTTATEVETESADESEQPESSESDANSEAETEVQIDPYADSEESAEELSTASAAAATSPAASKSTAPATTPPPTGEEKKKRKTPDRSAYNARFKFVQILPRGQKKQAAAAAAEATVGAATSGSASVPELQPSKFGGGFATSPFVISMLNGGELASLQLDPTVVATAAVSAGTGGGAIPHAAGVAVSRGVVSPSKSGMSLRSVIAVLSSPNKPRPLHVSAPSASTFATATDTTASPNKAAPPPASSSPEEKKRIVKKAPRTRPAATPNSGGVGLHHTATSELTRSIPVGEWMLARKRRSSGSVLSPLSPARTDSLTHNHGTEIATGSGLPAAVAAASPPLLPAIPLTFRHSSSLPPLRSGTNTLTASGAAAGLTTSAPEEPIVDGNTTDEAMPLTLALPPPLPLPTSGDLFAADLPAQPPTAISHAAAAAGTDPHNPTSSPLRRVLHAPPPPRLQLPPTRTHSSDAAAEGMTGGSGVDAGGSLSFDFPFTPLPRLPFEKAITAAMSTVSSASHAAAELQQPPAVVAVAAETVSAAESRPLLRTPLAPTVESAGADPNTPRSSLF